MRIEIHGNLGVRRRIFRNKYAESEEFEEGYFEIKTRKMINRKRDILK